MFHFMNFVRPFVNYAIFRELCDRMRFEVDNLCKIAPSRNIRRPADFIPSASIQPFSWAALKTLCLLSTLDTVFLLKITNDIKF